MTLSDLTPTYADLCHYADLGRRLTQAAGYSLDQHPPVDAVLAALFSIANTQPASPTPTAILDAAIAVGDAARIVRRQEDK